MNADLPERMKAAAVRRPPDSSRASGASVDEKGDERLLPNSSRASGAGVDEGNGGGASGAGADARGDDRRVKQSRARGRKRGRSSGRGSSGARGRSGRRGRSARRDRGRRSRASARTGSSSGSSSSEPSPTSEVPSPGEQRSRREARGQQASGGDWRADAAPPASSPFPAAPSPADLGGRADFARVEAEAQDIPPMSYDFEVYKKQIAQALELRKKYRIPGGKQYLPPSLLGFDPSNRDGIPCNGARCDKLLSDIAQMGFDEKEANFENICVQARPDDASAPAGLFRFNQEACAASPLLANLEVDSLSFGTLSHSHLHQCLKNINGGAAAQLAASFCNDGKLSWDLVATRDPDLAKACRQGLKWEILHWKIHDHPGALQIIQAACNRKGASQMRETEVQLISRLAKIGGNLSRASGDGRLSFARAREALATTMPEAAGSAEFLGLLRYVVTLGADNAPFIDDLKKFVGMRGQGRHVRAQLFAEASKLPSAVPHLMVAVIVTAFTAPPAFFADGYSRFIGSGDIRALVKGDPPEATAPAQAGEAILRYFHRACGEAKVFAGVGDGDRLDFLSKADSLVCRLLTEKPLGIYSETCPSLSHLAEVLYDECKTLFKKAMPQKTWAPPKADDKPAKTSTAPARKGQPDLEPRLISYDKDGHATNSQDVHEESRSSEVCAWRSTLPSDNLEVEQLKSLLMMALSHVNHCLLDMAGDCVEVRRWSTGEVEVLATKDIPAHGVAFAPAVSGMSFFALSSKKGGLPPGAVRLHGFGPRAKGLRTSDTEAADMGGGDGDGLRASETNAEGDGAGVAGAAGPDAPGVVDDLAILPCLRLPPRGVSLEGYEVSKMFVHPFWAMEREAKQPERCNCQLVEVTLDMVMSAGFGQLQLDKKAQSMASALSIPVLTNTEATAFDNPLHMTASRPVIITRTSEESANHGPK